MLTLTFKLSAEAKAACSIQSSQQDIARSRGTKSKLTLKLIDGRFHLAEAYRSDVNFPLSNFLSKLLVGEAGLGFGVLE